MKRAYDFQQVRKNRPYTVQSLAKQLDVNDRTVRRWIKYDGLDAAIIDHDRPIILQGAKVKEWGKARQKALKQPCAENEIYCVRCKVPRQINPDSFHIIQRSQTNLTVKGDCKTCGLTLHRFGSVANRAALEGQFAPNPTDGQAG